MEGLSMIIALIVVAVAAFYFGFHFGKLSGFEEGMDETIKTYEEAMYEEAREALEDCQWK